MSDRKEPELTYALTYRDVVEILRLINESSSCESIELELGELRLSATRAIGAASVPRVAPAQPVEAAVVVEAAALDRSESGLIAVRAPMLGTFYRAPAPGQPPYVKVGDVIDADETIGLIDVMKLFTQIPAGVAGRVAEILARNAELVEHGQPLMLIDPLPGESGA
jgi:acetyl-CoA carboxylase biotin carboxyl carrier protein